MPNAAFEFPLPSKFLKFTISVFQHKQTKISQFSETKRNTIYWPYLTRGNTWCHLTLTLDLDQIFRLSNVSDRNKHLLPERSHAKLGCSTENRAGQSLKLYYLRFYRLLKYLTKWFNTLNWKSQIFRYNIWNWTIAIAVHLFFKWIVQPLRGSHDSELWTLQNSRLNETQFLGASILLNGISLKYFILKKHIMNRMQHLYTF